MRAHFVFSEEPVFHPRLLAEVVERLPDAVEVTGVTALREGRRGERLPAFVLRQIRFFGIGAAMLLGADRLRHLLPRPLRTLFGVRYPTSLRQAATQANVQHLSAGSVNSRAHLDALRELAPDVIVSSCGQIFRADLLSLPAWGCINRHSALLPQYGGIWPVIWALQHGEEQIGVTIHRMSPEIDGGDIVAQRSIPVSPGATLIELYRECFAVSADLITQSLVAIADGSVAPRPQDPDLRSYFREPSRQMMREFRRQRRIV